MINAAGLPQLQSIKAVIFHPLWAALLFEIDQSRRARKL
jgi:hypothetical protein